MRSMIYDVSHLAIFSIVLADVRAVEKLSIEQLNGNHSKDELKRENIVLLVGLLAEYLEQDVNN